MKKNFDDCYIVMSVYGIQRMTKRRGQLARGEIAVKIRVSVPEKTFDEPTISATIDVPESAIIRPQVDVEVHDAPLPAET